MFENEIVSESFKFTTDNLKSFSSDKRCSLIEVFKQITVADTVRNEFQPFIIYLRDEH